MRIVLTVPPGLPPATTVEMARHALQAAVAINRGIMAMQHVPRLYEAGLVFRREPNALIKKGIEQFDNCLQVLERGGGDCDDLVAYRVAELQHLGETGADLKIIWPKGTRRYHAQVRREDGTYEDPSRVLLLRELRAKGQRQ